MPNTPTDVELLEEMAGSKAEDFHYFVPLQKSFLDEAISNQDDSKEWKIGGYASSENEDLEGESIVPGGLDIDYFLRFGWFNNDHQKGPEHKVGVPTSGRIDNKGFYVEGYLIKEMPAAQGIYQLMKAIASGKYKRNIGFSVEGKVLKQEGKKILKAWVKDVAITANPVNTATYANLVKSLKNCEVFTHEGKTICHCKNEKNEEPVDKGLEAGYQTSGQTGGDALRVQDLERKSKVLTFKGMSDSELVKHVMSKYKFSEELAKKVLDYSRLLKSHQGKQITSE